MGQLVSLSPELPQELLSSSELPTQSDDDDEFPEDPWSDELSELVLDLEAATLEESGQGSLGALHPSINLDNATPQEVLGRLMSMIATPPNRHYERYGAFATKDAVGLKALLSSCLRPEVAKLLELRQTSSAAKYAQPILYHSTKI